MSSSCPTCHPPLATRKLAQKHVTIRVNNVECVHRIDTPFWLYLIDQQRVMSSAQYAQWMDKYVHWLKSSRLAAGVAEILLPGEIESRRKAQRLKEGVVIPDQTWRQTVELASKLGVELADIVSLRR